MNITNYYIEKESLGGLLNEASDGRTQLPNGLRAPRARGRVQQVALVRCGGDGWHSNAAIPNAGENTRTG